MGGSGTALGPHFGGRRGSPGSGRVPGRGGNLFVYYKTKQTHVMLPWGDVHGLGRWGTDAPRLTRGWRPTFRRWMACLLLSRALWGLGVLKMQGSRAWTRANSCSQRLFSAMTSVTGSSGLVRRPDLISDALGRVGGRKRGSGGQRRAENVKPGSTGGPGVGQL